MNMNLQNMPRRCPSCEESLDIVKLTCGTCSTTVEGGFSLPRLARLATEDQRFIELLVLADGSLKTLSAKFGVSYPTTRKRLDEVIGRLEAEIRVDDVVRGTRSGSKGV